MVRVNLGLPSCLLGSASAKQGPLSPKPCPEHRTGYSASTVGEMSSMTKLCHGTDRERRLLPDTYAGLPSQLTSLRSVSL